VSPKKNSRENEAVKAAGLERVKQLMKEHEDEARIELDEQFTQQVPGHVIYFVGVMGGAFLLNLLLLILITGGS
jgi:hypoxanthine-guanine phosphoribosyltransferase